MQPSPVHCDRREPRNAEEFLDAFWRNGEAPEGISLKGWVRAQAARYPQWSEQIEEALRKPRKPTLPPGVHV
jgi:hypothetical protein